MTVLVANNAYSTLASSIASIDTTLTVSSGDGALFPAASSGSGTYFYATLINTSNELEIVKVTNRSTDTMTVVRGEDGTSARAYSSGDRIELRPTAALFADIRDSERTPLDDSVATAKIQDTAVTLAKLDTGLFADTADARASAGSVIFTPDLIESAAAPVTLSDAATIAVNWDSGINFIVTLGGNRALGFPTNIQVGTWRRIQIVQDGTGSRTLSFTATGYYSSNSTAPTLSTDASAVDVVYLYARSSSIVEVYLSGSQMGQIA